MMAGRGGPGGPPGPPGPGAEPAAAAPAAPDPAAAPGDGSAPASRKPKGDTNEIATVTLTFRAVSLKDISGKAEADKDVAYEVLKELQRSSFFNPDPQETRTTSEVINDEPSGTFTFSIAAKLARPLKL